MNANAPLFSAARIAQLLTAPGKEPLTPTPEQSAVIEHPLRGSTLVVAGAGSGKTETMANRVVWLVANGLVAPEQVLGLTFTRKAAGELRERISSRLEFFSAQLSNAAEQGELSEAETERAYELSATLSDGLSLPEVSTYNAFAAGVLQEFGAAAGIAPGAVVIDEATAWRVARETVLASADDALSESELRTPELIRHTIALDHAVADNLTSLHRVDQVVSEFQRVTELPYNEKEVQGERSGKVYADLRNATASLAETPLITRLAAEFAAEKQRRGLIEFSDQLALATRALESAPDAVAAIRRRSRVILLDEVQDTSVGQTRLLAMIFAGAPVMAVGDPHQSIYGWRGASAEGLQSFHADFRGSEAQHDAATLTLSTSWRNPNRVLDAANAVSAPLAAESVIDVPQLLPRPGSSDGGVEWLFPETVFEEQQQLAAWVAQARDAHLSAHGEQATAAVVFRKRSPMGAFSAALTAAGVPNQIVGLGGLLTTPEVTDVVSTLRCVWYADAGGDLIRLLAGPRFRIGVSDLAGLRDAARWFSRRDFSLRELSAADRAADEVLPDPDREFTLIDALDQISGINDPTHRAFKGITPEGAARLQSAGRMLAALRQRVGGDIGDLIAATVHALRLDIELEANEARGHDGSAAALANLDVFAELVENYLAVDTRGTLPSLLEWIERATEADETAEHVAAPAPGTVQLITAHGAKGLEWDIVAIPRLVEGEFPGASRSGSGWLRTGQIPDELRGDANARPELNWRIATTQKELKDRITDYKAALKERHADEERRLAYVAITRSADRLLLSGSFWGGQKKARTPSVYLREMQEAGLIDGLPEASAHEEDPSEREELSQQWPLDPLGRRAPAVHRAAESLRAALASHTPATGAALNETVRLLLAERDRAASLSIAAEPLPERITASSFHEFVEDAQQAERRRLRPVPQRPFRRTRVGNRFHEWVERRATTAAGTALPLFGYDPEEWDPGLAEFELELELEPLIEVFERSRWAGRQPIAVEQEVTLPFAGRTLVCKLDAVFLAETDPEDPAAEIRYEVVDWKAGKPPRTDSERESRFFQLDLYRHAYAQWAGIAPERIDVSLFYVSEGVELTGHEPRSLSELEHIWQRAAESLSPNEGDPHP